MYSYNYQKAFYPLFRPQKHRAATESNIKISPPYSPMPSETRNIILALESKWDQKAV